MVWLCYLVALLVLILRASDKHEKKKPIFRLHLRIQHIFVLIKNSLTKVVMIEIVRIKIALRIKGTVFCKAMFSFHFRTSVFCNPAGTSSIYRRIAQGETKDSKTRGAYSLTQKLEDIRRRYKMTSSKLTDNGILLIVLCLWCSGFNCILFYI